MTPAQADEALFGDALACEQHRPAAFAPAVLDEAARQRICERAEALLHSIAVVEDSRVDEPEEHGPTALALQRIEARLDVLTLLVARLAGGDGDPDRTVRWSATGARLVGTDAVAVAGTCGLFRIQPCDWLPEALQLPARVIAVDTASDAAWLRFESMTAGLVTALERHLFRVHRREIAIRRERGRTGGT